jgi:predicted enzyme related to lactoylglutathione lyase
VANRWTGLTVDCAEPERLAKFWAELLRRPLSAEHSGPEWAAVGSRHDPEPRLTFQRVPEPRTTKVRIHIDVQVDDIASGRAQVESLGGCWSGQRHDYPGEGVVLVMHDLEGNEFCLVQYYD